MESNVHPADHGDNVTIPCQVTRNDDVDIVYKWYRDGEEVASISDSSGTLRLERVNVGHRGRYQCVIELTVSGVGGQPIEAVIGAVTIGVGGMEWGLGLLTDCHMFCSLPEPPTFPSPPTNLRVTMVTAHTLMLKWNPPESSGNLPLIGYVVEVLLLGTSLCPQLEPEWEDHQTVEDPDATDVVVTDLVPYQRYQVRIRARNSAFRSDPLSSSNSFMTGQAGEKTDRWHAPFLYLL